MMSTRTNGSFLLTLALILLTFVRIAIQSSVETGGQTEFISNTTTVSVNTVEERPNNCNSAYIKQDNNLVPFSCEDKCGYVVAATDNSFPCHCDQACWLYGDCCSDYYSACLKVSIKARSDRILLALLDNLTTYSQMLQLREDYLWSRISYCSFLESANQYFQMVNRCSRDPKILAQFEDLHRDLTNPLSESTDFFMGLSKKEIRHFCERSAQSLRSSHVLYYTHVTLASTHGTAVHFYNVFCAICNGINPSHVTAWATNVSCDNQTLNVMETNFLINFSEAIIPNNCTMNAELPTHYLRTCVPHKLGNSGSSNQQEFRSDNDSTVGNIQCSCMSWNYTTWLLCQRYQYPFMDKNRITVYKNLYCFSCSLYAQAQEKNSNTESTHNIVGGILTSIDKCEKNIYSCHTNAFLNTLVKYVNNACTIFPGFNLIHLGVKIDVPSIRIMFDFGPREVTSTVSKIVREVEQKTCPQGQVYVPLNQSCRPAVCLPGMRWLHDQCVSVSDVCSGACPIAANLSSDYIHLPFPNGSNSIRLNIDLDYILDDDSPPDSIRKCNLTNSHSYYDGDDDGDYDYLNVERLAHSAEKITATNLFVESVNQAGNNDTCSASNCSLHFLFELSNLKYVWVKQMNKKLNSTESKQNTECEMLKLVLLTIRNKIIHYLNNASKIYTFIVCPNSTCLIYSINSTETDKSEPKVYPYNPCSDYSGRSNKTKYRTLRIPDVCHSFVVHLNSGQHFDTLVRAMTIMISDIVRAAHEANFILSRITITNMANITNDIQTGDVGARNSMEINGRFATSSNELCENNEILATAETQVERHKNGTRVVNFNGTNIELPKFLFNMEIYRHPDMVENRVNLTTVSWCQVDLGKLNCGSLPLTFYNSHNFVIYKGNLVLTLKVDKLKQFLHTNRNKGQITYLMMQFALQYGDNNWTIVHKRSYIEIRAGVLVCADLTNKYLTENNTVYSETIVQFYPDSEVEILSILIAYVLSIFCLAYTLVVYSLVPSLRNVPGKIVMSFSVALLCAQVLFLCCRKPEGLACEVYASVHHAAWLASYAWLAALSVHLACSLSSPCNIHMHVPEDNVFKILTAVCWGIPGLLAGVCLALHKTKLVAIGYGNNGVCWIGSYKPLLILFGVPVFLILAVTLVCAVVVLRAIRKSINFRSKSAILKGKPWKQFFLCASLSLLMGFSWVFYFLAVGIDNTIVWAAHILVNGSQGLYVFLCFAARQSLLSTLISKLKLETVWAIKSNASSDTASLKFSPTTVTPIGSSYPSAESLPV